MGTINTQCYAKRLTAPYKGVVQMVENEKARALSLNGVDWELQFMHEAPRGFWGHHQGNGHAGHTNESRETEMVRAFARVARWDAEQGLSLLPLDPRIEAKAVKKYCDPIVDCLTQNTPPFTLQDHYEYWLLDATDQRPLALLSSCCTEAETEMMGDSRRPTWSARSANELELFNTAVEQAQGLPPITYRLEQLIKRRAGQNPVARWFLRDQTGRGSLVADSQHKILPEYFFPATLLREDWQQEKDQLLVQGYINRIAPWLLMLQRLPETVRDQLEEYACAYATDVADFYHLYQTIVDKERMTTIRVEARLRLALGMDD